MVVAMPSDKSLWARSCACAAGARPKASADTSEMPAARRKVLDMRTSQLAAALTRGLSVTLDHLSGFASGFRGPRRLHFRQARLLFAVGRRLLILRHFYG